MEWGWKGKGSVEMVDVVLIGVERDGNRKGGWRGC